MSVAILANKGRLAMDLLEKIKMAYEYLPKWMQQGIVTWNKGNIELENGSKVLAAATSSSAVRGGSYNILFLDEFAFVQKNLAEQFFASVYPTISSGTTTQIIIVSTPNGMNHYYKLWMDAVTKKSAYIPIDVHWREVPGRDDKFKETTIKNTSEQQWMQEFETEFLGSAHTLINPSKIRNIAFCEPLRVTEWGLQVWEEPIKKRIYSIIVDTSHGVGQDYSVASVIDITDVPYKLVAKYRSNETSPMIFPEIIAKAGMMYNNAIVLVETNDVGIQVADALHTEIEYEGVLSSVMKGRAGQKISTGFSGKAHFGIRTTAQVKKIGCANIKDLIESDKLLIRDFDCVSEMSTFIRKGPSYSAEEGSTDDIMMTLVLFGWLVRQAVFKEMTDTNVRKNIVEEQFADFYEDVMPAGIIDDGEDVKSISRSRDSWLFEDPVL
jgi:hypothetical protein